MSDTTEEPRVFQPGDVFRDHYLVRSFIGEGTAGQVYVVEHRFTGQRLALKVSHLKDRGCARLAARALIEGKAGFDIQHRNVVRVLDLAIENSGMVWQLMELLDGGSVSRLLTRYGKLSPIYAIDLVIEMVWGLQAAHEQQIIHRDVHPGNVFVTAKGEVKVLDFSLAKVISSGLQTTAGRRSLGTVAYMGPEQIRGGEATEQFDVYAVGIMLWELLVGRHPFEPVLANEFTTVNAQLNEDPASLVIVPGLPAYCDEVIRGATAKDPARRYAGMWPLARALIALRARLLADPEGAALREPPQWERALPILRAPEGHQQYDPPRSIPRMEAAPHLPSRRVVVPQATPVPPRVVAVTVPMAALDVAPTAPVAAVPRGDAARPAPGSPTASPLDAAALTVRAPARAPARPRRLWPLLLVPPALVALGVGLWLGIGAPEAHPPAAPSSSAAQKAPPSSAPAAPRRTPAPRPGR